MEVLYGLGCSFMEHRSGLNNDHNPPVKYDAESRSLYWQDREVSKKLPESGIACIWQTSARNEDDERNLALYIGPNPEGMTEPTDGKTKYRLVEMNEVPPQLQKYVCKFDRGYLLQPQIWIISILSGTGEGKDFFNRVIRLWSNNERGYGGAEYTEYRMTDSEEYIYNFAATQVGTAANQGEQQSIFLLSGDGGVFDLINGLFSRKLALVYCPPTIGLLPFGTGNALANSLGINADDTRGLRTIYNGEPRALPTFKANFY